MNSKWYLLIRIMEDANKLKWIRYSLSTSDSSNTKKQVLVASDLRAQDAEPNTLGILTPHVQLFCVRSSDTPEETNPSPRQ